MDPPLSTNKKPPSIEMSSIGLESTFVTTTRAKSAIFFSEICLKKANLPDKVSRAMRYSEVCVWTPHTKHECRSETLIRWTGVMYK